VKGRSGDDRRETSRSSSSRSTRRVGAFVSAGKQCVLRLRRAQPRPSRERVLDLDFLRTLLVRAATSSARTSALSPAER
jgi:hypothetical protein